jgi:poly(3-hydroxybutyrate) depolymerase
MSKPIPMPLNRPWPQLLVCVLLLLIAATSQAGPHSPMLHRVMVHDNIEREFFVFVPDGADAGKPMPVVLAIHGYTSTATGFAASHGMNRHAQANGYIVVYPQGSHFVVDEGVTPYRVTSWNDLAANLSPPNPSAGPHCTATHDPYPCPAECGQCNSCAWTSCYDDLGFIEKVLDTVAAEFSTDTARYYLLGVSNGGMMALRLGCNLSNRFAAVAPIIAQLAPGFECGPTTQLPMLHLAGGEDNTVRIDGKPAGDGFIYATAEATAQTWADALECTDQPAPWSNRYADQGGLQCTAYSQCSVAGQQVVSCGNII